MYKDLATCLISQLNFPPLLPKHMQSGEMFKCTNLTVNKVSIMVIPCLVSSNILTILLCCENYFSILTFVHTYEHTHIK